MRKMLLATTAFAALASPLAMAASAHAAVAVDNGTGHVDKGDVQTALHWNNADFDKGSVAFTANATNVTTATRTFDNVLTCKADAGAKAGLVEHVYSTSTDTKTATGEAALNATPVLNSNGKQVTGWNLTGSAPTAVSGPFTFAANDLMPVLQRSYTLCLPDKPLSEMTPTEMRRQALWTIDNVGTVTTSTSVTFDGLKVNGVSLPNTPVVTTALATTATR